MSKLTNTFLQAVDVIKPTLKKLLPIELLRILKAPVKRYWERKISRTTLLPYDLSKYEKGVNLIGSPYMETGLGQSTRLLAEAILKAGYPLDIRSFVLQGNNRNEDRTLEAYVTGQQRFGVSIFHINPYEIYLAYIKMGQSTWDGYYNIAFWLWELEEFPDEWLFCTNLFQEIWTPSEFISKGIREKTSCPVYTIPYAVSTPGKEGCGRAFFNLPEDRFLFLGMYDSASTACRKNPEAVISAFQMAFKPDDESVGLVLKINNALKEDLINLKKRLSAYRNIYFITEVLEKTEVNSLIDCVDVYVSLHRSEGFGLVMAEAMCLGTPVIATNWSSNTEFMNSETACLVDYSLIKIEKTIGHFKKGQHWADADAASAAGYMKRLKEDRDYYWAISENAKAYAAEKLGMEASVSLLRQRMETIYASATPGKES